jgi:hypothetical protein
MKLSFLLMSLAAVLLAGCTRVIERPVYVTQPAPAPATTVVTPAPAAAGPTSASCVFASQSYSHGALSCQDRTEFKCDNGIWRRTFTAC